MSHKRKKSYSSSSLTDFQQVYGDFLCDMLHYLVVKDDGEVMAMISKPYHIKHGEWDVFYGGSSDKEEYASEPTVTIRRLDRATLRASTVQKLWKEMAEVDELLLQDYNDVLKRTDGKWSQPISGNGKFGILGEILNITKQWRHETKNSLKMTFVLRGSHPFNVHDFFYPRKLMVALGKNDPGVNYDNWESDQCEYSAKPFDFE